LEQGKLKRCHVGRSFGDKRLLKILTVDLQVNSEGAGMPTINVNGKQGSFEASKRLVVAIKELGVNIGHRCGGNAKCTTCRVEISSGEPDTMTKAEYAKLTEKGLLGQVRLSCQMTCAQDMVLAAPMVLENQTWTDTGPQPAEMVMPEAVFVSRAELE
jgi:ferredoxin